MRKNSQSNDPICQQLKINFYDLSFVEYIYPAKEQLLNYFYMYRIRN